MAIEQGTTLGHYEVLGHLGAGGMGEVYRALDAKLGREVAIKLLPEGFSDGPERMARFEREAKVLASLNHPNDGREIYFSNGDRTMAASFETIRSRYRRGTGAARSCG